MSFNQAIKHAKFFVVLLLMGFLLLCSPLLHAVTADPVTSDHSSSAIINGIDVPAGNNMWTAALVTYSPGGRHQFCGGTLIAPLWVLTAAHCVDGPTPGNFSISLGRADLDTYVDGSESFDVSEIIVNPRYSHSKLANDIALIRLIRPTRIQPLALPSAELAGTLASSVQRVAYGWGLTRATVTPECTLVFPSGAPPNESDYSCGSISYQNQDAARTLKYGLLSVLTNDECYRNRVSYLSEHDQEIPPDLNVDNAVTPGTLCVLDSEHKFSACYGDSGGPLMATIAGREVLVGIASFVTEENCKGAYVQGYTEVAHFLDFINLAMASNRELNFAQLCPGPLAATPSIMLGGDGSVKVLISWRRSSSATGYTLFYQPVPRQGDDVGRIDLPVSDMAEFSLPSGAHYTIAMQARGKDCDGPLSELMEVRVP